MEPIVKFHSSVIFVTDIGRSKQFYKQLLGLTIEHDFGTNVIFYGGLSIWQINPDHVISKSEDFRKAMGNRFELCFETDEMEAFMASLKDIHITKLHDIIEEPWGQMTVRFYDPDGHLIEVGESLGAFVYKFYKQGMTIDQVSKRTSVSVEAVTKIINERN